MRVAASGRVSDQMVGRHAMKGGRRPGSRVALKLVGTATHLRRYRGTTAGHQRQIRSVMTTGSGIVSDRVM